MLKFFTKRNIILSSVFVSIPTLFYFHIKYDNQSQRFMSMKDLLNGVNSDNPNLDLFLTNLYQFSHMSGKLNNLI